jgi:hypothetical protein
VYFLHSREGPRHLSFQNELQGQITCYEVLGDSLLSSYRNVALVLNRKSLKTNSFHLSFFWVVFTLCTRQSATFKFPLINDFGGFLDAKGLFLLIFLKSVITCIELAKNLPVGGRLRRSPSPTNQWFFTFSCLSRESIDLISSIFTLCLESFLNEFSSSLQCKISYAATKNY